MSDEEGAEKEPEEEAPDPLARFVEIAGSEDRVVSDDDRAHVFEQVAAKRWDDLGVLEHEGRLLFPEKIWKRDRRSGKFVGVDVILVVPRGPELRKARREAYELLKEDGLDPVKDRDQFKDLEDLCILWYAIRDPAPTNEGEFPPHLAADPRDLEKRFDRPSLDQVYNRLDKLRRAIDPKVSGLSAGELAAITAAMVARQDLAPLAACDGATQHSLLITLAALHQAFVMANSSAGSSAPSRAGS